MTICRTVLALLLATSVLGQTVVPQTPAGRVFTAWLAAFNSADPARIRAFEQAHRSEARPLEETLGFREQTGGFNLLRIEKSEPLSLVVLLQGEEFGHCRSTRVGCELRGAAENRELASAGHSPSSRPRCSTHDRRGRAASAGGTRRGARKERSVLGRCARRAPRKSSASEGVGLGEPRGSNSHHPRHPVSASGR